MLGAVGVIAASMSTQAKPGWQTPQGMGIPLYDPAYGRQPPPKVRNKR
jgi:hypothetical protein